ncbi:MAG: hypothetical protein ACXADC_17440 [Candidatus Thorarchaeota archaeon]|jgi:hypothetical protein
MGKSASSILVLLKNGGPETLVELAIGDGSVLWSGHNGFEWIGKEDEEWDSVYLIKYPSTTDMQQSVKRFRETDFEKLRLYSVKPQSRLKIGLVRFMMKYIYSRSSAELLDDAPDWNLLPIADILPTKEQQLRLAREKQDSPIVMVNFLSYHDEPKYPSGFGGKRAKDGESAYGKYSSHAMRAVAKLGGVLECGGEIESLLVGESELKWKQFGIMRYHTLEALHGMFRMKENIEAGIHRDAGLKNTRVYAFTPDNHIPQNP